MYVIWIKFFLSALVIIFAGIKLTQCAKIISERIGLGMVWGGLILLPLATSLPELVTSWRAATINSPDLALGNLLGSILFNLSIIALIDIVQGKGALISQLKNNHILAASFTMIIAAFTGLAMVAPFNVRIFWLGLDTIIILILYVVAIILVSYREKKDFVAEPSVDIGKKTFIPAILTFMIAGMLIIFAGTNLADAGEAIAVSTGLGQTFVGTLMLAVSTSLPEVVTTMTAVRMGYLNMAVANIFGANLMNLVLIFLTDLFYIKAPVLAVVSEEHLSTVFFVIIITSVAVFGIIYRTSRQIANMGFDSVLILAGYIMSFIFLYFINV